MKNVIVWSSLNFFISILKNPNVILLQNKYLAVFYMAVKSIKIKTEVVG